MPPARGYSGGEMLRMQREAEQRVTEMRNRTRAMQQTESPAASSWSSPTGRGRQMPSQPLRSPPETTQREEAQSTQAELNEVPPEIHPDEQPPARDANATELPQTEANAQNTTQQPPRETSGENGTILGDVMGALGVEEDSLLIIGLLLILINQRADTTLLLALAYLLI